MEWITLECQTYVYLTIPYFSFLFLLFYLVSFFLQTDQWWLTFRCFVATWWTTPLLYLSHVWQNCLNQRQFTIKSQGSPGWQQRSWQGRCWVYSSSGRDSSWCQASSHGFPTPRSASPEKSPRITCGFCHPSSCLYQSDSQPMACSLASVSSSSIQANQGSHAEIDHPLVKTWCSCIWPKVGGWWGQKFVLITTW